MSRKKKQEPTVMPIGKHKGKTLAAVMQEEPSYLCWFFETVDGFEDINFSELLTHSVIGLVRVGLLEQEYQYGPIEGAAFGMAMQVQPSVAGMELFEEVYRKLSLVALDMSVERQTLKPEQIEELRKVLEGWK